MQSQLRSMLVIVLTFLAMTFAYQVGRSHSVTTMRPILRHSTRLFAKMKYKVTIQHEGKETVVECREDESILNAAKEGGIELPHDCELGVCLTFPAKVVSGLVDHSGSTLEDTVQANGYALTCCLYPRSDVTITSIDEDELVSAPKRYTKTS